MHYKFHKVYIEITNICGLECSFCPTKTVKPHTMSISFFKNILQELQPYTKNIALHVFGDPLTLKNLTEYLDLAFQYKFKVEITTTGYFLKNFDLQVFLHKAIKQINFSLNSYNKNSMSISLAEYLQPMFDLSLLKLDQKVHSFINFRLWNLDDKNSENKFNLQVLDILSKQFKTPIEALNYKQPFRLENQILLNFDNYFEWPSLRNTQSTNGYCHGLSSQIAILSSGVVVPCCLDSFGIINLGDLHKSSLKDILYSQKALAIKKGFENNIAVEELCQKCSFKHRFQNR